jgi:tetratricopeptide (TPR) repeat protein
LPTGQSRRSARNDLASAGKLLAEARRLAPADARGRRLAGVLAEQGAQTDAAIEAYERAAAGDPRDLPSRWSAARLLADKPGSRPRAIRALEDALEQAPANVFLLLRLSELRRAEGDRSGAEAALEKAVHGIGRTAGSDDKLERFSAEAKDGLRRGRHDSGRAEVESGGESAAHVGPLSAGAPRRGARGGGPAARGLGSGGRRKDPLPAGGHPGPVRREARRTRSLR